jgi:hypothetical protein
MLPNISINNRIVSKLCIFVAAEPQLFLCKGFAVSCWSRIKVHLCTHALRCGCAAAASVHAALPHKDTSLRLCRKTETEKMYFDTTPLYQICLSFAAEPQRQFFVPHKISFAALV